MLSRKASPTSCKAEAAWKLIEFLQSPEAEAIDARVGGELPTRKSTLKDPFFQTPEVRHLRLPVPSRIRLDGRKSTAVILKPAPPLDESLLGGE